MKISALLALGFILSLSAFSARGTSRSETLVISVDQQLKITSEILGRKHDARMLRTSR